MPDDVIVEEEQSVAEPETDADFDAAFGEEAEGTQPAEKPEPKAKAKEPEGEPPAEPPKAPEPPAEPEAKTAKQLAEEEFAELIKPREPAQLPPQEYERQPGPPSPYTAAPTPDQARRLTKEQVANILSGSISLEDLPDAPVIIGNDEINPRAFAEGDPDAFNTIRVLAGLIAQKQVEEALANRGFVTTDDVQGMRGEYEARIARMEFDMAVARKHPDYPELTALDPKTRQPTNEKTRDFVAWLDKESDAMKYFAFKSENPAHANMVLDAYKESKAKAAVKEHDTKAAELKKKKDDIAKHGIRSKPVVAVPKDDLDDFEAGFAEVAGGR